MVVIKMINGLNFVNVKTPVEVPSTSYITVVEFWATWCPPCRTSIPHLTEMAHKYKERHVVFVGVTSEDANVAEQFVAKMGSKMDYPVAVDSDNEATEKLMQEFGVRGIPHAFILDQHGSVVYHGHPMEAAFVQALEQAASKYEPIREKTVFPITASREELLAAPVKDLKAILRDKGVAFNDLHEKTELVDRIFETCT